MMSPKPPYSVLSQMMADGTSDPFLVIVQSTHFGTSYHYTLIIVHRNILIYNKGTLKTFNGIVITTDNDIVNTMNNYFGSVFTIEQLNNVPQLCQYEGNILDTFNFSTEEVQEKPQHLNLYKSIEPDMLHPRILRESEDKLDTPLTHIFNNSVGTGIIPEDWKLANMTAIHKKGSRQEPGNYRPISLTSVVCKTMERLV